MERHTGRSGTYLISWSQTLIDGHADVPEAALAVGAYWRWSGAPVDIGDAAGLSPNVLPAERPRLAADAARRVIGRALGTPALPDVGIGERAFVLSDGREAWRSVLIDVPGAVSPLLLFADGMPPADIPLRINGVERKTGEGEVAVPADEGRGMVCFTPGTWIETPRGARQIEHLAAGDKVMTIDGGAQELVWIGSHRLALRELYRIPERAPVRIREGSLGAAPGEGDLVVSPDHRMLVRRDHDGRGESAEILVAARDLVDGVRIAREPLLRPVVYVHLLLERHHIILANGFEAESFHPAAADLGGLSEGDRMRLFDVMPMLKIEPQTYGPWARPALSQAEAALLTAA